MHFGAIHGVSLSGKRCAMIKRIGLIAGGVVIVLAVLLSLRVHEQPVHHIETPILNVTIKG